MVRVALQISYVESICYVFRSLPLVQTHGEEKLICGLRVADGRSVLLGEKGHPDSDFLLILFLFCKRSLKKIKRKSESGWPFSPRSTLLPSATRRPQISFSSPWV